MRRMKMSNDLTKKLLKGAKKRGVGNSMKDSEFSKIDYYVHSDSILLNLCFPYPAADPTA